MVYIILLRTLALFSGQWDKRLQRDNNGRIFLDVNPKCFQAFVDYLNDMKMSTEDNPPSPPSVGEELNHILLEQAKLFGISDVLSNVGIPGSKIISHVNEANTLHGWLKENDSGVDLELLYRSSRDGLSAKDFHTKCDSKGSTITIIETECGCIFGGYSSTSWNSGGGMRRRRTPSLGRTQNRARSSINTPSAQWDESSKAFLFFLSKGDISINKMMKLRSPTTSTAILNSNDLGPTFGRHTPTPSLFTQTGDTTPITMYDLSVDGNRVDFNPGGSYENESNYSNLARTIKEMEVYKVSPKGIIFESPLTSLNTININETSSFAKGVNEALNVKLKVLKDAEKEISGLEKRLEDHEKFIDLFCTGDTKDVVMLNVSGTSMTTKRSTLRVFEESVLARQFDDTTWTDQNGCKVKEWTPTEVYEWVGKIEGIPDTVAVLFKENDITGRELLALNMEGLKMIGIERAGTLCLLLEEIKEMKRASQDTAPLFEQSPYCFGKLIDHLRLLNLHSHGLVDAPQLPTVRDAEKDRFEKVIHYFFPGDSSKLILGGSPGGSGGSPTVVVSPKTIAMSAQMHALSSEQLFFDQILGSGGR